MDEIHVSSEDDELMCNLVDCIEESACSEENDVPMTDNRDRCDGFDDLAGASWHYPVDMPERAYQYNIVRRCLFSNTLVVLPTGLGKTFVAAVVMYNFCRWYPEGKTLFLAHTRPLVNQQTAAFKHITNMSSEQVVELTGSLCQAERVRRWSGDANVFLMTPQSLINDLKRVTGLAQMVKCIVFDEAHKAVGNYAYTKVIKYLQERNCRYRVLALTATPGNDLQSIQLIVSNLHISAIEMRTEESMDVRPYCQSRFIEAVVTPLTKQLHDIQDVLIEIAQEPACRLRNNNHISKSSSLRNMSRFSLLQARDSYRKNSKNSMNPSKTQVETDFYLLMICQQGQTLLYQHGARSLYFHLKDAVFGNSNSRHVHRYFSLNGQFVRLFDMLRRSFDSSVVDEDLKSELIHPKLAQARELITKHFENDSGRVIIFSQYRESVHEITETLENCKPLVRAIAFTGQATGRRKKGVTQKEQADVLRQFHSGTYNTLVATSVAEEGLDIADVNMIICFDSNRSSIQFVQRIGRTGRKRSGKIIMLLTAGKEASSYSANKSTRNRMTSILRSHMDKLRMFEASPRMVPVGVSPVCERVKGDALATQGKQWNSRESVKKGLPVLDEEMYFWTHCLQPKSGFISLRACMTDKPVTTLSGRSHSLSTNIVHRLLNSKINISHSKDCWLDDDFVVKKSSFDIIPHSIGPLDKWIVQKPVPANVPLAPSSLKWTFDAVERLQAVFAEKPLELSELRDAITDLHLPRRFIWPSSPMYPTSQDEEDFKETATTSLSIQRSKSPILTEWFQHTSKGNIIPRNINFDLCLEACIEQEYRVQPSHLAVNETRYNLLNIEDGTVAVNDEDVEASICESVLTDTFDVYVSGTSIDSNGTTQNIPNTSRDLNIIRVDSNTQNNAMKLEPDELRAMVMNTNTKQCSTVTLDDDETDHSETPIVELESLSSNIENVDKATAICKRKRKMRNVSSRLDSKRLQGRRKTQRKLTSKRSKFLHTQAVNQDSSNSEDEGSSGGDEKDNNFIDDDSSDAEMTAEDYVAYARGLPCQQHSPLIRRSKVPSLTLGAPVSLYSQQQEDDSDEYQLDSFVVSSGSSTVKLSSDEAGDVHSFSRRLPLSKRATKVISSDDE